MQSKLQCTQLHFRLQSLASLATLSTLKVSQALLFLESRLDKSSLLDNNCDNPESYLADQNTLHLISTSLISAASLGLTTAAPAMFAWGIFVHTLKSFVLVQRAENPQLISENDNTNGTESWMEVMMDMIQDAGDEQEVETVLMSTAVDDLKVYDLLVSIVVEALSGKCSLSDVTTQLYTRLAVLKLIRIGLSVTKYSQEVLVALLASVAGNQAIWLYGPSVREVDTTVVNSLLDDEDVLFPHIFQQAQMRFPFETVPFIRLCNALRVAYNESGRRSGVIDYFQKMPRFTQRLPPHYRSFELAREDELPNCIRLTQDLPVFALRHKKKPLMNKELQGTGKGSYMAIPERTIGFIISDSKPPITAWEFEYSMLRYLTVSLTTLLSTTDFVEYSTRSPLEFDAAAETINLLVNLIDTSNSMCGEQQEATKELLQEISTDLDADKDIISVVCDLFEQELHRQRDLLAGERSLDLLVNCAHFIRSIMTICPERTWAFLRRSVLIDLESGGGAMIAIISSVEMVLGEYEFLRACLQLFESLVDDIILNSVARKVARTRDRQLRFKSSLSLSEGFHDFKLASILKSCGVVFMDILKSLPGWKFNNENERLYIGTKIADLFQSVLQRSYGVDCSESLSEKLAYHLAELAEFLAESLLSGFGKTFMSHQILHAISNSETFGNTSPIVRARVEAMLNLADTLIKTELHLMRPASTMRQGLLDSIISITKIFSVSISYELPVLRLLRSLVRCMNASLDQKSVKPCSLLQYLGPQLASHFVVLLTQKLVSWTLKENEQVEIWKFFSSLVADQQQWFTILLLQGHVNSHQLSKDRSGSVKGISARPVFTIAMDQIADIQRKSFRLQVALLELIISIQRVWPAANREIYNHSRFLPSLLEYLPSLLHHDRNVEHPPKYFRAHVFALVVEIIAFYVQNLRLYGNIQFLQSILPKLSSMRAYSLARVEYNHSLHSNLARNVEKRFPSCTLLNFKNTAMNEELLGESYFYNRSFAANVLNFDTSWKGQTQDRGFSNEFTRANINLSLVEAQLKMLQSWGLLMLGISAYVKEVTVAHEVLNSIECALKNDVSPHDLPLKIFARQSRGRLDHSFILLQRLATANSTQGNFRDVMSIIWNSIKANDFDFENPFEGETAGQYRRLLKLLYLSLNSHAMIGPSSSSDDPGKKSEIANERLGISKIASDLTEIMMDVITKGFRSLANQIHVDPKSRTSADFALLTAILQAILKLPGVSFLHSQLALQISNFSIPRYAMSLYSWSDELLVNGDPIYGELSIKFILELSSVPIIAEFLAIEGLLSQISAANIMNFFRRQNGMSPFSEPHRLFSIWTRAILPLCLNLLEAVGPPIASEVVIFLNQFPNQLSRATGCLKTKPSPSGTETKYITLSIASEIYTLSLISHALDHALKGAWASGIYSNEEHTLAWDKAGTKEELESLLEGRRSLRDKIIPHYEYDAELARSQPSVAESDYDNLLEEKVFETLKLALNCLGEE